MTNLSEVGFPISGGLLEGGWTRAKSYEVIDGYIRPVPGAKVEHYGPLESDPAQRAPENHRAYIDLIDIVFEAMLEGHMSLPETQSPSISNWSFSTRLEERLCKWCQEHGLLGLFHHEVQTYTMAPHWHIGRPDAKTPDTQAELVAMATTCVRDPYHWSCNSSTVDVPKIALREAVHGDVVPQEYLPQSVDPPHAIIKNYNTEGEARSVSLGSVMEKYFPDVPNDQLETFEYPVPISDQFWEMYAEPLDAFVTAALKLGTVVGILIPPKDKQGIEHHSDEHHRMSFAKFALDQLAEPVKCSLIPTTTGKNQFRLISPSLLSSLAVEAMLDLSSDFPVRHCEVCGKIFIARREHAAYCSPRCRNTALQRRYRAKKRRSKKE